MKFGMRIYRQQFNEENNIRNHRGDLSPFHYDDDEMQNDTKNE